METFSALGPSCFFSSSSSFAQHAQSLSSRSFVPRSLVLSLDQIYIPLLSGSKTPWAAANCQPCYTHLATLCLSTALGHSLVRTHGRSSESGQVNGEHGDSKSTFLLCEDRHSKPGVMEEEQHSPEAIWTASCFVHYCDKIPNKMTFMSRQVYFSL